ncbi:MAG TPA: D-alanine--D-alanine ligase A, partial [Ignavibacteriaceae bacterium]
GRELECAVLGNGDTKASFPGEIVISDRYEFYTYEAKYEDETAVDLQIPAKIDTSIAEKIKGLCVKSFKALHCEDFARVDLFVTNNNGIYINEINTIPGFTNVSMFPSLWAQHGISYPELITQIIELAVQRNIDLKNINRSFDVK